MVATIDMIETIDPTTGRVLERFAPMDDGQINAKLEAAARSASSWAAMALLVTLADVPPAKAESTTSSKRTN